MSNTFRNRPGYEFPAPRRDKKRRKASRVCSGWTNVAERANRRATRIALVRRDWDEAMDIGAPRPESGILR